MPQLSNLPFRECIACDMQNHRLSKVLDHPDGSVTLDKLSNEVKDKLGAGGFIGENTKTFADGDIAFGTNNTAGRMAYYIEAIDTANKKIYLSRKQHTLPDTSSTDFDTHIAITFERPNWEIGDNLCFIGGTYRDYFGTISSLVHNVVGYEGDLAIDTFAQDTTKEGYTLYVPEKPDVGLVELGENAFVVGKGNKANGRGSIVAGEDNIAANDHAAIFGLDNQGACNNIVAGNKNRSYGHNSAVLGQKNTSKKNWTTVFGRQNVVDSESSVVGGKANNVAGYINTVLGLNNEVDSGYGFVLGGGNSTKGSHNTTIGHDNQVDGAEYNIGIGRGLKIAEGTRDSLVVGRYNIPRTTAVFVVGNGKSSEERNNAMQIHGNGDTNIAGDLSAKSIVVPTAKVNGLLSADTLSVGEGNTASEESAVVGHGNTSTKAKTFVAGRQNNVNAEETFVAGKSNKVSGAQNAVTGVSNAVDGEKNTVGGYKNTNTGNSNTVFGSQNVNNGKRNVLLGNGLLAEADMQDAAIMGQYNAPDADARFILGNGTGIDDLKNAIVVKKTGEIIFDGAVLDANGNEFSLKSYVDDAVGDIGAALDELHAYAQALVNGGAA